MIHRTSRTTALVSAASLLAFAFACSGSESSDGDQADGTSAASGDTGGTVTGGTVTGGTVTGGTVTGGTVTGGTVTSDTSGGTTDGTSGGTTDGTSGGTTDGTGGASTTDAGTSTGGASTTSGGGTGGTGGPETTGLIPGTQHYNCDPPTGDMPELQLTPYVTSGLDLPIYLTHAPNETDRLFVIEQNGVIKIVRDGAVEGTFLDITGSVSTDPWEQGLLGLAFHPDFAENGLFYIHYNALGVSGVPDQANVVSEFKVSADNPDVADPSSERILLTVDTDRTGDYQGYHNGGSIFIGLEGELFIALGDGAGRGPGEATMNSQNVTTLRGTLSRIIPEQNGDQPYSIPAGNMAETTAMVGGQAVAPEIWSYGLRNPFRSNMDACTGDIYYGDVGHFDYEEVNVEPAGTGQHNYGWPVYEGTNCFNNGCSAPEGYRPPVVDYPHNGGSGAVIGGSVYRGSAIPALRGTYFFTDLYGNTRAFRYDSGSDTIMIDGDGSVENETNAAQQQQTLVAIQNGGDGELYFVGRGGSTNPNDPPVGTSMIYKLEAYGQ